MRRRTSAGLAAIALLTAVPSLAVPSDPAGLFRSLKAGQWVQLEGAPQKDQTVLCSEAKILTGDLLEDDWNATGIVRSVDQARQRVYVHRLPIRLRERVEYESPSGTLKSFPDIKPGMLLDIEGTYMKDGTLLAKEVEDESEKLKRKPEWQTKIQFVGRIEKLDPARRTITLMGTVFVVTDRTRIKSVLK